MSVTEIVVWAFSGQASRQPTIEMTIRKYDQCLFPDIFKVNTLDDFTAHFGKYAEAHVRSGYVVTATPDR
ncbi:MAG: hypothetical protein H3C27_16425 [Opitutaceae bacterium]|nr:hypothetical protein [Opitutaceae bacterium]